MVFVDAKLPSGEMYLTLPQMLSTDQPLISTEWILRRYDMTLLIESDGVTVEKAECPDKICQSNGKLTQSGQSAVCVPSGVTVILDGANAREIDGVAR